MYVWTKRVFTFAFLITNHQGGRWATVDRFMNLILIKLFNHQHWQLHCGNFYCNPLSRYRDQWIRVIIRILRVYRTALVMHTSDLPYVACAYVHTADIFMYICTKQPLRIILLLTEIIKQHTHLLGLVYWTQWLHKVSDCQVKM